MWKEWKYVTESERDRIAEIAERYQISKREVANMYQGGLSFEEIVTRLERE